MKAAALWLISFVIGIFGMFLAFALGTTFLIEVFNPRAWPWPGVLWRYALSLIVFSIVQTFSFCKLTDSTVNSPDVPTMRTKLASVAQEARSDEPKV